MKSNHAVYYSLLLVVVAHVGALGGVLLAAEEPRPLAITPPTIQGVIVSVDPEPPKKSEPLPPPPPEQKPLAKPKSPLPKAPPSERAVHQEAVTEPAPSLPVAEPQESPPVAPVVPPRADANHLNNAAPVYPSQSKRLREEGTVLLEVLVKADGSVGELRLKTSSGFGRLDEAALRAVKSWHFEPARLNGEAIDFLYDLPVEFSLNK